jgi:hypothetical protein
MADEKFRKPLLVFAQTTALRDRLTKPQVAQLDHNVYVRRSEPSGELTSIYRVPTDFQSPEDLHAARPEFDANSKTYHDYFGPLFKGAQLSRFELLRGFPGAKSSAPLSESVLEVLGWQADRAKFPGAFPVVD